MKHKCRFCASDLNVVFADLGMSPIANSYIASANAMAMEPFYPLKALVCESCFLVQLIDFEKAENLFSEDYAYFSSYSESWLAHSRDYAVSTIERERLDPSSLVVEIASNDGYLLQYFKRAGIGVLGIEPTANTAEAALSNHGIESEIAFFGLETAKRLAERGVKADVIAANNVLAHVPDPNDFVSGYPLILKKSGVANFEFPHLLNQIKFGQFDTIYHEHFSYLSLLFARKLFARHGLRVYDAEELSTHGGSLRLYVCHRDNSDRHTTARLENIIESEIAAGLDQVDRYRQFADRIVRIKCDFLEFLIRVRAEGKSIAGYGAPAKGNTLLNYCGVKPDLLPYTVDRSPHKSGKLLPGTRIPILDPSVIRERKPDYLLILPWNLRDEISEQLSDIRSWGGKFVCPIPKLEVF